MSLSPREKYIYHHARMNALFEIGKPDSRPVSTKQLMETFTMIFMKHRGREFQKIEEIVDLTNDMNEEELNSNELRKEFMDNMIRWSKGNTDSKLDFRE